MGRASPRLPGFCLNRIATERIRVRSPPPSPPAPAPEPEPPSPPDPADKPKEAAAAGAGEDGAAAARGRRIMVVADSGPESKTALLWALSHSVQSNDAIVLVAIVKPSKRGEQQRGKERDPKSCELLQSMKNICHAKKPEAKVTCMELPLELQLEDQMVELRNSNSGGTRKKEPTEVGVELSLVEGTDRGPAIVEETRRQSASLLIMGQKKRSLTWRLIMMSAGSKKTIASVGVGGGGVVADYCVACTAVAVRRKSQRAGGGYLITTKRHRDFWLLA